MDWNDGSVLGNGLRLHYLHWPSATPRAVVLLHGLRGHAHGWDDVARALQSRANVFALDQRGRGDSDWPPDGDYTVGAYVADLAAVVEHLGYRRVVLVGHSMGATNAACYAAKYPETVEALALIDSGPEGDPAGAARIAGELRDAPEEFPSLDAAVDHARRANPRPPLPVLRRRVEHQTRALADGRVVWRYDRVIRDQRRHGTVPPRPDLWPVFRAIACPLLLLRGAESDVLSAAVAERTLAAVPGSRLVTIPDAGHMVFEDNGPATIAALEHFLDSLPTREETTRR